MCFAVYLQFIESRDSCAMKATKPVFTLRDSGGDLWPLIVLEEVSNYSLFLFCFNKSITVLQNYYA